MWEEDDAPKTRGAKPRAKAQGGARAVPKGRAAQRNKTAPSAEAPSCSDSSGNEGDEEEGSDNKEDGSGSEEKGSGSEDESETERSGSEAEGMSQSSGSEDEDETTAHVGHFSACVFFAHGYLHAKLQDNVCDTVMHGYMDTLIQGSVCHSTYH